jgi:hypothetical protein
LEGEEEEVVVVVVVVVVMGWGMLRWVLLRRLGRMGLRG